MLILWIIMSVVGVLALFYVLFKRIRPWWQKILYALICLVLIVLGVFNILVPSYPIIESTGELTTTTSQVFFEYDIENSDYQTSEGRREIPVTIWHPEEIESANKKLVLFSHGSFGVSDSNDSLFTELASHGYTVASLGHPYHSFATTLEDGSTILIDNEYLQGALSIQGHDDLEFAWQQLDEWAQVHEDDMRNVLELMETNYDNIEILEQLDFNQIILSGHSLGGASAIDLGRKINEQVLAVIALEAPFTGDIISVTDNESYEFSSEDYPVPILHIYSDATWDILDEWVLYEQNYRFLESEDPRYFNEHIPGTGHIGLTDLNRFSPLLTNFLDGGLNKAVYTDSLGQINEVVLDFLTQVQ